jgi:hypothetical protein
MENHGPKQKLKKVKTQDPLDKMNLIFYHPALQPLGSLATWLHVGAPQKNEVATHFEQNFTMASYGVRI